MTQGRNGELRAMQGNQVAIDSESVSPWDEGPSWMQHYRTGKCNTENASMPKIATLKCKPIKQQTQPRVQPWVSSGSSPRLPSTKYSVLKQKQSNSCHTNSNSNVNINVQTQKVSTVVRNKLYQTLERLAIKGIPDSGNPAGFINRNRSRNNLQYYRKKDCVENRYAKWKTRIQMLGKRDSTGTPRLPKIEICWL